MKWQLNPPTPYMWASWYMTQWDIYIESQAISEKPKFKSPTEESYQMFREVMQVIDASFLDITTYQYDSRALVSSVIFLVLGKHLN